jgi:Shedu protein SduA, C-terminal
VEPGQSTGRREQHFLVRSPFRAAVGWRTIEVYPEFNADTWNPDIAALWAETDLLAAVARRNLQEAHYAALDPHAAARQRMIELLRQLEEHLNGPEEPLHQFIRQYPQLLSPTYTSVWSKLPLGNRATDFVFKEPPTDYLLVELERASHRLFREDGQQKEELTHAIDQVMDWRRYIEDNHDTVQRELGLQGISVNPRALVVIGRRAILTPVNERKLVTMNNATPRLRILTYDDVLTSARATAENMLGPLWTPGTNAQVYFFPPT